MCVCERFEVSEKSISFATILKPPRFQISFFPCFFPTRLMSINSKWLDEDASTMDMTQEQQDAIKAQFKEVRKKKKWVCGGGGGVCCCCEGQYFFCNSCSRHLLVTQSYPL